MHQARLKQNPRWLRSVAAMTSSFEPFRFAVRPGEPAARSLSLNMRAQRHSVYKAVSRVPPSINTCAVQKHLHAQWMRFSDSSERLQTVNCSMAMMLKAVGYQLAEPVTQGQPYLSDRSERCDQGFEFPPPEPVSLSASFGIQPSKGSFASSSEIAR